MPDFTAEQNTALEIAHHLADLGAPIFSAYPNSSSPGEFLYPNRWQDTRAGDVSHNWINRWKPGMCLAMVTGVVFDVLDIDPRNGGREGAAELAAALGWNDGRGPTLYGTALTPSEGEHHLIGLTGLAKGKPAKGVDLQAGDSKGEGRGFIFLAPTVRPSKYGSRQGEPVTYQWLTSPTTKPRADAGLARLVEYIQTAKPARRPTAGAARPLGAGASTDDDLFDGAVEIWTPESARRQVDIQLQAVEAAKEGEINNALGGAARVLGRFVAGGFLEEEQAARWLLDALEGGGVHSDRWNLANGKSWTAQSVIATAFGRAAEEPWEVHTSAAPGAPLLTALPAPAAAAEVQPAAPGSPRLLVESAATMAYWLQQEIGRGRLAGFFARQGELVHTPRVSELGYVPAADGDGNGPAEIRAVTPDTLTAKIQFLYACYKNQDVKGPDGKKTGETIQVPALFPAIAAKHVVHAPEALGGLRPLKGITHTPMVRADGTLLTDAGYDPASGFLFLPGAGVDVQPVPDQPTTDDRAKAITVLEEMIAGFPFASDDDRANYLGLLLTPMLRELAPPSYKLFGISAHQPGSGKSLLADIVTRVHGSVFRSEVPDDEYGWRQMTASLLATTSAPVVIVDNVTGVLRSSVLAGLLTASGELQERELGRSSNLTFRNDRTWVVTGNNMSLGGDLVRRTITIMIDPDMANPETRTDFAITDLPRWVDEHRNNVLWALLVLVRSWVAIGRPAQARKQSDSFAAWETAVGGILAHAGVAGMFDDESGKRAAGGGDDDGLALALEHLREKFGDRSFGVAEALQSDGGQMVFDSRDWLPSVVLDKLARNEASGRKTLGHWLRNRIGRWVTGQNGVLVLRSAPMERGVARWRVEQR